MNKNEIKKYIPVVDFLSLVLGDNCEIVLHDLTCKESSIIAIRNGQLSGREVGGSSTDFVLKILQNKSYKENDFVANYYAEGKAKKIRSSSFLLKIVTKK